MKSIGSATMLSDKTIELRLRAEERGIIGTGLLVYPPDHKYYQDVLNHIPGLEPGGEAKPVTPWD